MAINIDPLVASAIQAQTALEKVDSLQDKAISLAMLAQMQALVLSVEKNWGELALTIPGSIRNSEANQAAVLATISNSLMDLNDNALKMTATISELSTTIKLMNSTFNTMAAVQKLAVSDQISANNFQQRETVAALQRNDIEPTVAPDFKKVIEQQITNSSLMSATTAFTTLITDFSNSLITGATNYISQTELVTWGRTTIEGLLVKLKLTKVANAVANPEEVAIKAVKNTVNTKAGAGLWAPTVIPPDL